MKTKWKTGRPSCFVGAQILKLFGFWSFPVDWYPDLSWSLHIYMNNHEGDEVQTNIVKKRHMWNVEKNLCKICFDIFCKVSHSFTVISAWNLWIVCFRPTPERGPSWTPAPSSMGAATSTTMLRCSKHQNARAMAMTWSKNLRLWQYYDIWNILKQREHFVRKTSCLPNSSSLEIAVAVATVHLLRLWFKNDHDHIVLYCLDLDGS